ncbi:MAG: TAXI family TRAP transporter solute-binding subunit [Caldilineaceae bacterium]
MLRRFPFLRYLFWVILVLLLIVGVYWFYVAVVLRTPTEFTIATGREGGAYYIYATKYAAELEKIGLTLHVQPTAGSVATLELLNRGEVPVGFVQSGTATDIADPSLYALASVFYEPIWVFYRREIFPTICPICTNWRASASPLGGRQRHQCLARSMLGSTR